MADAQKTIAIEVNADASKAEASVGSFKKQLREANNELLNMASQFGETSKEAINAAKKVAGLKDAIGDAKALADTFNPDKKFVALGGALQGAVGGFSALQGAMGLFGSEGKEIEKVLLKVQSAMALQQGISAIAGAMDSFKLLGAEIVKSTVFMTVNNSVTAITTGIMKLLGISVDTTSFSFKLLKGAIAATGIGLLVIAIGELISKFQDWNEAAQKQIDKQKELDAAQIESSKVAVQSVTHKLELEKNLAIAKATSEAEKFAIEQDFKRRSIILLQQHYDNVKGLNDKEKEDAVNKINDLNNAGQVAAIMEKQRIKKDAIEKQKINDATALKEQQRLDGIAAQEKIKSDAENKLYIKSLNDEKTSEDLKNKDKIEIKGIAADSEIALAATTTTSIADIEKAKAEEKKKDDKILFDQRIQMAGESLNILSDIVGKESAAGKAMAISSALINTYLGISAGVKLGFPAAIPAVLAAAVTGFKAVKNIIATKVPGGGGGGGTANIPSATSLVAPIKPEAQTTTLSTSSINQIGVASSRAFVLESDVTNNQERIQRLNRAARIN